MTDCTTRKVIEIIQGEQQPFTIDLISKETGKPYDLTSATDIEVCFSAESSSVTKNFASGVSVVGDPVLGQITGTLEIADTTALTPTAHGHIEVTIISSASDHKKAQLLNQFIVLATLC
jgi:hypothetical protein